MEGNLIEQIILEWLDTNRDYAVILVPVLAFAESCIGIGLFVSGVLLLLVSATLYNNGLVGLEVILSLSFVAALLGDHSGYYIARFMGPKFHQLKLVRKYQSTVIRAEDLIRSHGSAAIFIGRFTPAIRSIIPAMVGISGFRRMRYSVLDALACLAWTLALGALLLGIDGIF
ncbi:MAG: VTT domain-containing protein [Pseudohongiellaceae bacterium]